MSLKSSVQPIINSIVEENEAYLVEIAVSESKIRTKISVFIDNDEGIQIDECGKISQLIGAALDEIIEQAYILEVSSPGADAPLKFERQYLKNIGRNLKITLNNGSEMVGKLVSFENGSLIIQPDKIKKIIPEPITIIVSDIKEAKVVISFK